MASPSSAPPVFPRGARPDAEAPEAIFLIKRVSQLRATYQVRLLAFAARQRAQQLILIVPPACRFTPDLEALIALLPGTIGRRDLT